VFRVEVAVVALRAPGWGKQALTLVEADRLDGRVAGDGKLTDLHLLALLLVDSVVATEFSIDSCERRSQQVMFWEACDEFRSERQG